MTKHNDKAGIDKLIIACCYSVAQKLGVAAVETFLRIETLQEYKGPQI